MHKYNFEAINTAYEGYIRKILRNLIRVREGEMRKNIENNLQ